jgi:hypothetical protein
VERVLGERSRRAMNDGCRMKNEKISPVLTGIFLAGHAKAVFNTARKDHLPELNIARAKAPRRRSDNS